MSHTATAAVRMLLRRGHAKRMLRLWKEAEADARAAIRVSSEALEAGEGDVKLHGDLIREDGSASGRVRVATCASPLSLPSPSPSPSLSLSLSSPSPSPSLSLSLLSLPLPLPPSPSSSLFLLCPFDCALRRPGRSPRHSFPAAKPSPSLSTSPLPRPHNPTSTRP